MRSIWYRIRPEVIVGIASGYLFCDTFAQALSLSLPIFGIHSSWPRLITYFIAPFVVLLSIALALKSRRAWILTQVYLIALAAYESVAGITFWKGIAPVLYRSPISTLPKGVSAHSLVVLTTIQMALNVLGLILLFALLRRSDVKEMFRASQPSV
jgi:asparagine N-glycosylation enzyme membrane subunit Stt3